MLLLIDKPKGITSHDVVDKIRKITGIKKVGHGGTLDPNATGLLIIGITREGTKKLGDISKNKTKEYIAEIYLGEVRSTDDEEGEIIDQRNLIKKPQKDKILNILDSFLGKQKQQPPVFSAIKVKGKKAYDLARKGKEVNLEERDIEIHSIELIDYSFPLLKIKTTVSSGTYIRAIARDVGEKLGTGAYLKNLRRTKIGEYTIDNAVELSKLSKDNWKEYTL